MQNRFFSPQTSKVRVIALPGKTAAALTIKGVSIAFALSLIMVLFTSCSDKEETPEAETLERVVSTQKAIKKSYVPQLNLSGTVFANQEANLGAGFPGRIEKIHYPEGTFVEKDQLLVEMAGEMLAQAEAEYLTLKRDYERVSRLVENGTVSRQEYDHVKARFDASTAKYELARKNTQIRAPFSGVIVDYMANEGENYFLNFNFEPGYSNTSGIVRLMQLHQVKVQVDVNEKDLASIQKGLKTSVKIDAFPGEEYTGEITLIKPYLSTRSRTSAIEITISNPDMRLKPGMFARVDVLLPEKTEVFIPMEAIYRDPETDTEMVFVVKDNTAQAREVERINGIGEMLVVTGIENGDEIIIGGKNRVQNGDKVRIANNGGK